jgi:hypothetical protein
MRAYPILLVLAAVACTAKPVSTLPRQPEAPQAVETGGTRPATFVQTTAEARAIRSFEVREGLARAVAMRTLVDALSQHFVVDVVDPRAGFAMTTWQANVMRDGVPDLRYRTRFTARFLDEWRTLRVQSEARWSRGDEADIGYDAAQLDSITNELRVKLGKRP